MYSYSRTSRAYPGGAPQARVSERSFHLLTLASTSRSYPTLCANRCHKPFLPAHANHVQVVPPELGFGADGSVLRPTLHVPDKQGIIPANAVLEYDIELLRVSIPPS